MVNVYVFDIGSICIRVEYFPRIHHIELCNKVQEFLSKMSVEPEDFTGRIIFMSMFNDISRGSEEKTGTRIERSTRSGEERVTAKSKPMMNLVSRCSEKTPDVLASTASETPVKTRHESQLPLSSWNEQHQRTGRPVLTLTHQDTRSGNVDIFEFVVVRSFTADSNLLQPTGCVNRTPSHVTLSRICMHSFQCRTTHWLKCLSASSHPCFMRSGCFDSLRLSILHSSPSLSSSFSFS